MISLKPSSHDVRKASVLTNVLRHYYVLCVLLTILVVILAPFHRAFNNETTASSIKSTISPTIFSGEIVALIVVFFLWLFLILTNYRAFVRMKKFFSQLWSKILASPPIPTCMLALLALPICLILVRVVVLFFFNVMYLALKFFMPLFSMPFAKSYDLSISWMVGILSLIVWYWFQFIRKKNPLTTLFHFFCYRKEKSLFYRATSFIEQSLANWLGHLLIFATFGASVVSFLIANIREMVAILWPVAKFSSTIPSSFFTSMGFFLSHAPVMPNVQEFFYLTRYGLFSVAIVACFYGYGHTLLSIFYRHPSLRWVDFTIAGWTANLICYGIWSTPVFLVFTYPDFRNNAPFDGPLLYLCLVAELLINFGYTLSIINMGKRFGVMVDKGLVTRGFYSVVRHPSYTLEPLLFIVMHLPGAISFPSTLGLLVFPLLYWLRSERDDHFMGIANPDYEMYRRRVPYKYFPGLW